LENKKTEAELLKPKGHILIVYILLLTVLACTALYLFISATSFNYRFSNSTEKLIEKRRILTNYRNDMFRNQMTTEHYNEEQIKADKDSLKSLIRLLSKSKDRRIDSLLALADNPQEQVMVTRLINAQKNLAVCRERFLQLADSGSKKTTRFLFTDELPAFELLIDASDSLAEYQIMQGRTNGKNLSSMLDDNQRNINLLLGISFIVLLGIGRVVYTREKLLHASRTENIAKRIEAESHLFKLSQAVQQSPASVIITDIQGNIQYVNPKFTEITGYSSEELIDKNPRIFKSGHTPDEVYKQLWETITSGKEWKGELLNKKKNGELYWERLRISPIFNGEGEIINFLGVKEDITESKKTSEQMNLLAEMLDSTPASVTIHDFEGNFHWVNKKTIEYHGFTEEELKTIGVKGIDVPVTRELFEARTKLIMEKGEAVFEVEHFRKGGSKIPWK